jgi:hypothetical protein
LAMDTLLHCVLVLCRLMLFFGGFWMQGNKCNFNVLSWKPAKFVWCGSWVVDNKMMDFFV